MQVKRRSIHFGGQMTEVTSVILSSGKQNWKLESKDSSFIEQDKSFHDTKNSCSHVGN